MKALRKWVAGLSVRRGRLPSLKVQRAATYLCADRDCCRGARGLRRRRALEMAPIRSVAATRRFGRYRSSSGSRWGALKPTSMTQLRHWLRIFGATQYRQRVQRAADSPLADRAAL